MFEFSSVPAALSDRVAGVDIEAHDILLVPDRVTDDGAACFQPSTHAIRALLREAGFRVGIASPEGGAIRTIEEHDDSLVLPIMYVIATVAHQVGTAALGEVLGSYLIGPRPQVGRVRYRELRADNHGNLRYREVVGSVDEVIAVVRGTDEPRSSD